MRRGGLRRSALDLECVASGVGSDDFTSTLPQGNERPATRTLQSPRGHSRPSHIGFRKVPGFDDVILYTLLPLAAAAAGCEENHGALESVFCGRFADIARATRRRPNNAAAPNRSSIGHSGGMNGTQVTARRWIGEGGPGVRRGASRKRRKKNLENE